MLRAAPARAPEVMEDPTYAAASQRANALQRSTDEARAVLQRRNREAEHAKENEQRFEKV